MKKTSVGNQGIRAALAGLLLLLSGTETAVAGGSRTMSVFGIVDSFNDRTVTLYMRGQFVRIPRYLVPQKIELRARDAIQFKLPLAQMVRFAPIDADRSPQEMKEYKALEMRRHPADDR